VTQDKLDLARHYLAPPGNYFWKWDDGGRTASWSDRTPIAFQSEILLVLEQLAPTGLPPLGSLVLLLACCNDNWRKSSAGTGILLGMAMRLEHSSDQEKLKARIGELTAAMDRIADLPETERKGSQARARLAATVFEGEKALLSPASSRDVVAAMKNGLSLEEIDTAWPKDPTVELNRDIASLLAGLKRLNLQTLALRLQTGLDNDIQPAEISLPEPEKADLLQALLDDPKTAAVARLAQLLLAAIRVPFRSCASSDQPVGGIADIANRGQLDRLLLSELAHDDLTLASRLATNEALYYRHESPPPRPAEEMLVFLDCGIRLWGAPRIFAIAVALAFAIQGRKRGGVEVQCLGKGQFQPVDLLETATVRQQLERFDAAPHPGHALQAWCERESARLEGAESVLITHPRAFRDPEFIRIWFNLPCRPEFVALVDRDGNFELHNCRTTGGKLEVSAQFDLLSLLREKKDLPGGGRPLPRPSMPDWMPLACSLPAFPLLLSCTPACQGKHALLAPNGNAMTGIANDRRLMYWSRKGWEGQELARLPHASVTAVHLGEGGLVYAFVFSTATQGQVRALLYVADPKATGDDDRCRIHELPAIAKSPRHAFFVPGCLLIVTKYEGVKAFSLDHCRLLASAPAPQMLGEYLGDGHFAITNNTRQSVRIHWNGSGIDVISGLGADDPQKAINALQCAIYPFRSGSVSLSCNFSKVGISPGGQLAMISGKSKKLWKLVLKDSGQLAWQQSMGSETISQDSFVSLQKQKTYNSWYSAADFGNGRKVVLDKRGVLHLLSGRQSLPELAIVIRDGNTAAWASDGQRCGIESHHGSAPRCSGTVFYVNIKKFLEST
jgi:hypothetical protein